MSKNENLLKATINLLASKLSSNLLNKVNDMASLAKEAPEKFKKKWDIFQEEVYEEASRLDKESIEEEIQSSDIDDNSIQGKIDSIRAQVSNLNKRVEQDF